MAEFELMTLRENQEADRDKIDLLQNENDELKEKLKTAAQGGSARSQQSAESEMMAMASISSDQSLMK